MKYKSKTEAVKCGVLNGQVKPTIVMNRGIATAGNLRLIREMGMPYALIERSKHERKYADLFAACPEGFEQWMDSKDQEIHLKKVSTDEGETRVLVKSVCRARKERAMDELQKQRFTLELEKVRDALARGKPKSIREIERRLGRIQQRYKTAARYHEVAVTGNDGIAAYLSWREKEPEQNRSDLEGTYVISTSHEHLTAPLIWELYITLTRVENAFRSLKSDLGLRPVFHQTEDRTCAHLLISVLAYHLIAAIENDLKAYGIRESWAAINATMNSLQRVSINYIDAQDQLVELRVSSNPEPQHERILTALKIGNPLPRKKSIIAKMT
ncbi:MAG: transposase [Planctomycetes bacterium]|nr:transposase [Planctomycetota bacterium]